MLLKSFGCSFIFGTDLHDDGRDGTWATPSQYSWPALLAQNQGYQYACYARPGSGNLQILDSLLNDLTESDADLYVIGWTYIDRFDYVCEDGIPWFRPWLGDSLYRKTIKWKTLMPIGSDEPAKTYYQKLHSDYIHKLKTLIYIKQAVQALRDRKKSFIMTYMDDLILCEKYHCASAMLSMMQDIKPLLCHFDGSNFLQWSRRQGYKISSSEHPLEQAHQAAAKLISVKFSDWVKN